MINGEDDEKLNGQMWARFPIFILDTEAATSGEGQTQKRAGTTKFKVPVFLKTDRP